MAVLEDAVRATASLKIEKLLSRRRDSVSISAQDVRAAVNAMDDFLDTNAAAINNALPDAAKNNLSAAQKLEILCEVAIARWGVK